MKYILILLILVSFISCKKEQENNCKESSETIIYSTNSNKKLIQNGNIVFYPAQESYFINIALFRHGQFVYSKKSYEILTIEVLKNDSIEIISDVNYTMSNKYVINYICNN